MKKAQVSIEFLFAVGVVFLIFIFVLGYAFNKTIETNEIDRTIKTKDTCRGIANAIMAAFISGNGTSIVTTINHNASIQPNSRLITVDDEYITCTIPINQMSEVQLTKGNIIVENQNNFINIRNE